MRLVSFDNSCFAAGWIAVELIAAVTSDGFIFHVISLNVCSWSLYNFDADAVYDLPVSGSITFVSQQCWACFETQKSVFCDKVLCLITQKSYSVTVMLVNVICFFYSFLFVCKWDHICEASTGWILANSPQRERFYFLRNEPHSSVHIWLLCTYYSQWPNQRFAHSFRPSASQRLFLGSVTEPHT